MQDLVITAVLTNGRDDFRTARKVKGEDKKAGELTAAGLVDYFRPATASAERFGHQLVVLHDGMPQAAMVPPARYCCAVGLPDWNAFERRWVAVLNYLNARDDVQRVWMVDANDVLFVSHPFAWMDAHVTPGQIAVGREHVRMGGNDWFEAGVRPLPPEYAACLTKSRGHEYGLTCGCWGADRATAINVLDAALTRITSLQEWLKHHPPGHPVCLDMFAFGVVWWERYADRLAPFAMDGATAVGGVPSPLLHDRTKAMSRLASW